jgi:hypothetical protein
VVTKKFRELLHFLASSQTKQRLGTYDALNIAKLYFSGDGCHDDRDYVLSFIFYYRIHTGTKKMDFNATTPTLKPDS